MKTQTMRAHWILFIFVLFLGSCSLLEDKINPDDYIPKITHEFIGFDLKTNALTFTASVQADGSLKAGETKFDTDQVFAAVLAGNLKSMFENIVVRLRIKINNPNDLNLRVNTTSIDVFVEGQQLTTINYTKPIDVSKNSSKVHELSFKVPSSIPIKALLRTKTIKLDGTADLSLVYKGTATPGYGVKFTQEEQLPFRGMIEALEKEGVPLDKI